MESLNYKINMVYDDFNLGPLDRAVLSMVVDDLVNNHRRADFIIQQVIGLEIALQEGPLDPNPDDCGGVALCPYDWYDGRAA